MTKVLVTGGTGSVGRELCHFLSSNNFDVSILSRSRNENSKYKTYIWDYKSALIEKESIESCDYIIHLAGAGIADKRWTQARQKEILESRTKTTSLLYKAISTSKHKIKGFISASAIGYYGQITSDAVFTEQDPAGDDFVAHVCESWEIETNKISNLGIRTVTLRIGIVLMKKGGALEKMTKPFHLGLGAILGNGKQIVPWIHIKDLNQIILTSIQSNQFQGVYNSCAPEQVSNTEFSKFIARSLDKKIWLPNVPSAALKLLLGKRAVLLTKGSRISVRKIQQAGFEFEYPKIQGALSDLLGEK